MKRMLVLIALALLARPAEAQLLKISSGDGKHKSKSGNEPPPLGPWYNYWPLEAHFQVPAMPEYPFFSAPQTVPIVPPAPYGAKSFPGMMPHASGMNVYGYPGAPTYPSMPYANGMGASSGMSSYGTTPMTMQPGAMSYPAAGSYPALSGYPAMGSYGSYPMSYPYANSPGR